MYVDFSKTKQETHHQEMRYCSEPELFTTTSSTTFTQCALEAIEFLEITQK